MQGASNVVSLDVGRARNKNWTAGEHKLLMRALHILKKRGEEHLPEYFEDDQGNPIVAFTVGYHVDATLSISKVAGRYVALRFDGACVADTDSLLDALSKVLYGGCDNPQWFFIHGLDVAREVYKESVKDGTLPS